MYEKIETRYYQVDPLAPAPEVIASCGHILRAGGMVGFPTETVYGLGANALDGAACYRIFTAKGRPQDNPLIVHVSSPEDVELLTTSIPPKAEKCLAAFWPGPLTLVLPKSGKIPNEVTAGLDTVAIRMPDHPVALSLIRAAGVPVAAPSANRSGRPSPTLGEHVMEDLAGRIEAVLDGGPCRVGIESTVLDLTADRPVILRPGGVTREELQAVLGEVVTDPALKNTSLPPRSPGVKYVHYAPRGKVVLVEGPDEKVRARIKAELSLGRSQGLRVGILCSAESAAIFAAEQPDYLNVLGPKHQPWRAAATLYHALRECDKRDIELILAETFAQTGMGAAVMNRLDKASGHFRIIEHQKPDKGHKILRD